MQWVWKGVNCNRIREIYILLLCIYFLLLLPVLTNDGSCSDPDVPRVGNTGLPPNTEKLKSKT